MRLLLVGINPGLWTAAVGAHFARPGNRFWPAVHAAGLSEQVVDASAGMPADSARELLRRGVGITNLVDVATARADELSAAQLREGAARLTRLVTRRRPRVVAILGLTAYRTAFGRQRASGGRQPEALGPAELWVLGNPSGLNAHETVATLATALRAAAEAAGVSLTEPAAG